MVNRIFADESLEVLLFVCAPLLLLLIGAILVRIRVTPRTAITLPTFSLVVSAVGQGDVYVRYRDENKNLHFDAEIGRGERFFSPRIYLRVPREMGNEDVRDVVPNLALGLAKLRYQYLIYRPGEPEAITELRKMGTEAKILQDRIQIEQKALPYWRRIVGLQAMKPAQQLCHLLGKARGIRENMEILARSGRSRT